MQYTNKYNVAPEIADAIITRMNEYDHSRGGYSATQLIDSPRIVALTKRHEDEITADVMDLLGAWQGHLVHDALEQEDTSGRAEVEVLGQKLSGAWDYYKDGELKDYKVTSVWTHVYGSMNEKYEAQLNVYAYILRKHGMPVNKAGIEFLFRDWSDTKAKFNPDYPEKKQMYQEFPVWSMEKAEAYIQEQMQAHIDAQTNLPLCTADDMWERPPQWAIMKKGRKSAVRVLDSEEAVSQYAEDKGIDLEGSTHYVEFRPGECIRCQRYCDVAPFCEQYLRNGR